MLTLAKIALGPVLLAQARHLRKTALRLPEASGPREGLERAAQSRVPQPQVPVPPVRLLFVGDSSAAGVGVAHQHQALAHQAAHQLAATLGRPVQWQLVARSGVNTREARDMVAEAALEPADLLITALGVNDVTSQRSPGQFVDDYRALVADIVRRAGVRAFIVNGVPPLHMLPAAPQPLRWYLGQCAWRLDQALGQWVQTHANAAWVSLQWAAKPQDMAHDRFHPGPGQYTNWAQLVADKAARLLAMEQHQTALSA